MTAPTIAALVVFAFFVFLAVLRFAVKDAIQPLTVEDQALAAPTTKGSMSIKNYDPQYLEIVNLGDVTLAPTEQILAACGLRGDVETVLLATDAQAIFFTRRAGASRYLAERFDYRRMRPVSLSGAVIGERIRVMEGDRLAEMVSPGAESWLDTAEDTIKTINEQIRNARRGQ
jgi:hypothetical protein